MIHRIVFVIALCAGAAAANAADLHWNGAGWYGVADDYDWAWIISGPYQDKASCDASLPADNEDADYDCEYLSTKPGWD